MTKFLLVGDLHLADRGPASRLDDWVEASFWKLSQIRNLASHPPPLVSAVDAVIFTGDLFHGPGASHRLLTMFIRWCQSLAMPVFTVIGNHDLRNDRQDSIPAMPLGVLLASNAVRVLGSATFGDVTVTGIPYPLAREVGAYEKVRIPVRRSMVVAHGFASLDGGDVWGEPAVSFRELATLPHEVIAFGHDHSYGGVEVVGGVHFLRPGAVMRGSIATDDVSRVPTVLLVEFLDQPLLGEDQVRVTPYPLEAAPADRVFNLEQREQLRREHAEIERFVGQLTADLLSAGTVRYRERVEAMSLPEEIRTRVLGYLEAAEG